MSNKPKSFYRVASELTGQGLWYDQCGAFTGFIHNRFRFCMNRNLQMPFDESIVGWLSVTTSLDELFDWFSKEDIVKLQRHGWNIYEYQSDEFRKYQNHWLIKANTANVKMRIQLHSL